MISIITVYHNKKVLDEWLLKSLKNQTVKFELITIDNTRRRYKSVAEALNDGAKKATGKYLMFVHQDVDLSSDSWLEQAEQILDTIPDLGIAGVAGPSAGKIAGRIQALNRIQHGIPPIWVGGIPIQRPERAQTLDECLIIIPRMVFERLAFDPRTCDHKHLYAVDYCLSVRLIGYYAYVIPMSIYHRSAGVDYWTKPLEALLSLGPRPMEYYRSLNKVLRKHQKQIYHLRTTCGHWYTRYPLILQRLGWVVKQALTYPWRRLYRYFLKK